MAYIPSSPFPAAEPDDEGGNRPTPAPAGLVEIGDPTAGPVEMPLLPMQLGTEAGARQLSAKMRPFGQLLKIAWPPAQRT
jgi:hypothetical protein